MRRELWLYTLAVVAGGIALAAALAWVALEREALPWS
jgi:hypothetical protein